MNRLNPALKGMTTSFYFIAKDDKRFKLLYLIST